ncbi:MAG: hypothetical protein JWP20_2425 [Roseomonas sp.]|nr:hypothetical protein [Roseomonas sp.]
MIGQVPLPLAGGGIALVHGGSFEDCPPGLFGLCLEERAGNAASAAILLPVPDFGLPSLPPLRAALAGTLRVLPGQTVYVGCRAGLGRTGTVLACLARLSGVTEDPVEWVRRHYHPCAIETAAQEDFARHAVLRP